jgi:5-methylcytosine-specific restriction enzyme A
VLACDLVRQNNWRWLNATDPRVIELSDLLQRLPIHPLAVRSAKFRNHNSVSRKTTDIATQHPAYAGPATYGNKLDGAVLSEFLNNPRVVIALAETLRASVAASVAAYEMPDLDLDDEDVREGGLLERRHLARERDAGLRRRKIDAARLGGGHVTCEACGFDFARTYGKRGADFIECHHRVPLHVSGPTTSALRDLVLLCSNCHRMIHHRQPWLTFEELQTLVRAQADHAASANGSGGRERA